VEVVRGTCLVSSFTDAVPASVIGRSDALDVGLDRILANRLQIGSGEEISVISPRQRLTPMGPLPVRVRAEIARVLAPEPGSQEGSVRLPLGLAQRLLWGDAVVEAIELRDITDPWQLGDRVRSVLGPETDGVRVEGLADLHRPLLLALAMERVMIFVAVGLMLVVAALNLLCNVAMVAAEKRVDLAVLAGIGLAPRALFSASGSAEAFPSARNGYRPGRIDSRGCFWSRNIDTSQRKRCASVTAGRLQLFLGSLSGRTVDGGCGDGGSIGPFGRRILAAVTNGRPP